MKNSLEMAAAGSTPNDEGYRSSQSDEAIPATAIPAAEPVERGRFVLHLHDRDEISIASETDGDDDDDDGNGGNAAVASGSPDSFDAEDVFEDAKREGQVISDGDLERLLGPLPSRRTTGESLEVDSGSDGSRRKRAKRGLCLCCPSTVRRGPWQLLAAMTGGDGSVPMTRMGNMIVVLPKCFHKMGFGIMGPHWFGPVCCFGLLTVATIYFGRKAYNNIGPISAVTCLLFYVVGCVSLCIVSCSDPGVVRSGGGSDGKGGRNGYAGVPTPNAGKGWRYCDLCSVYQPPDAVHCPECNVCVMGYDHHCPWMGTCIGKKNFNSFVAFNVAWTFYLLYSIIWVTLVGGTFFEGRKVDSSSSD